MTIFTLCLMRHAEAQNATHPQGHVSGTASISQSPDFNRTLSPRGISQAVQVGKNIHAFLQQCDKAIVSSATRTKQTAELVFTESKNMEVCFEESLYTANHPHEMSAIISSLTSDKNQKIIVIGHNPVISTFASYLTEDYVSFAPSEFIMLEIESDQWQVALNSQGCWQIKHN